MRLIHQHDERDCGAACLSMIASHYGLKLAISKCREVTRTDKSGTNLYGLVDGAKQLGLKAEPLRGTPDELLDALGSGEIKLPFIAHVITEDAMLHFVVVERFRKNKFYICDPGKGKIALSAADFFQIWTGYVITFEKAANFQTGNYVRGGFLKFFSLLRGQYAKLLGVLLISFVITTIGILGAFVFEFVIDEFAMDIGYNGDGSEIVEECIEAEHTDAHGSEDNEDENAKLDNLLSTLVTLDFHWVFISLIGLYMLQALIQYIRGYLIVSVSRKIDIRLTLSYYSHIIDLPLSSVSLRQTGEYLSRFSDTSTIRLAISGATLTILIDSFMVVACGCILFLENRALFGVSLLMVLFYAVIVLCYRRPVEKSNRRVMDANASVQSYLKESIDGIETIKASCANEEIKANATARFDRFIQSVFRNSLLNTSQDALADAVELIGTVVILWIGFSMVLAGQITIGSLITFYALLSYFTTPIKNLIELQPTIQTAFVAADRLNDILDMECEESNCDAAPLSSVDSLILRDVSFRYGNRDLALDGINLSVHKGERIAVVGPSGCGKTTLAKLLLRFYEPEKGTILINGEEIQHIDLSALRRSIAYVDQNNFLFADSVKNNLKLGNPTATDEDIEHICKICKADDFICQLPFGYDTPLDENGADLSGGQKQRLAIARALLKQPKLLILDEATSNLDVVSEAEIKRTIEQCGNDFACIIIAHRLSTVQSCDRIYVMDRGKIVESGTHEELKEQSGVYAALLRSQ